MAAMMPAILLPTEHIFIASRPKRQTRHGRSQGNLRDYADIVLRAKCLVLTVLIYSALSTEHSALFAQDSKYAAAFLEIPVGSRALAMGGAYTAIADDEAAFHW